MKVIKISILVIAPVVTGTIVSAAAFNLLSHFNICEGINNLHPLSYVIGFFAGVLPALFALASVLFGKTIVAAPIEVEAIEAEINNASSISFPGCKVRVKSIFAQADLSEFNYCLNFSL